MNETVLKIMELLKESGLNYRVLCDGETNSYTITLKEKTK